MKYNILISTKSGNNYYYNKNSNYSLIHPVLKYIVELVDCGVNIDNWLNDLPEKLIIENKSFAKTDIVYYYKKYLFFSNNYLFEKNKPTYKLSHKVTPNQIELALGKCNSITFEVTEKCNLKCSYCTYSENFGWFKKRMNKNLSFQKAKNFLNYFFSLSNIIDKKKNLSISFYGGEPLLNIEVIRKIVSYVNLNKSDKTNVTYSLTTNGVLLKQDILQFLVDNNFEILISLDGDEQHNSYRISKSGKPVFNHIIKNIFSIQKKFPIFWKENIDFNTVLHSKNSREEVYTFFKNKFNKVPEISEFSAEGVISDMKKKIESEFKNFDDIENKTNKKSAEIEIIKENLGHYSHRFDSYLSFFNNYTHRLITGTCIPFSVKAFITVRGDILPCENVNHIYSFGTVSDDDIYIDYDKIAKQYNEYYDKLKNKCYKCNFADVCSVCILSLNKFICEEYSVDKEVFSQVIQSQIELLETYPKEYSKFLT